MGSFEDSLRQRSDEELRRKQAAQAASDVSRAAAATAVDTVKKLLKDCADYLNSKTGPTHVELAGHTRLRPKKSPAGYELYGNRPHRNSSTPTSLVMLTADGRLWRYTAKSDYSRLSMGYTEINSNTLADGVDLGTFAGHRKIVVARDGSPTVSINAGYDSGTEPPKPLHEWLAEFAFHVAKRQK